jgi:4,5-DOPA dioxygenase extradiol
MKAFRTLLWEVLRNMAGVLPTLFIGHGNPMNGVDDNEFSAGWTRIAGSFPKPKAVLCISAHWETEGSLVTSMPNPPTIHDFYGFPRKLFDVQYPAPGSDWLAGEVVKLAPGGGVKRSLEWGLDHGCWVVLRRMYPDADVPVVQLSLDITKSPRDHYELAKRLSPLREDGILILGSGNMVHNLGLVESRGGDFNVEFGFPWALKASNLFKKLIDGFDHDALIDYQGLGEAVRLAVPTNEHYLPMLYSLAQRRKGEPLSYFNDKAVVGSLTMTSFRIG